MKYDTFIIKVFFKNDKLYIKNFKKFYNNPKKYKDRYNNIKHYLACRYTDSESLLETLYRIFYNIEKRPVCKTCGAKLKLYIINSKKQCFPNFCSISCANKHKDVYTKHNMTCLKKYGSVNNSKKRIETCLKKYGETTPLKNDYIKEKIRKTNIEKYGVNNPAKSEIIKEKTKNTCLMKYGVNSTFNLESCKSKSNTVESQIKQYNTKQKNKTFNTSKPEDQTYIILKEKYPDVIRQYRSHVYPFNCDFYIPSLDLYIECQYGWLHGGHAYDDMSVFDKQKLELWKSKNTEYYNNAINTWTVRDVNKRNIAKQNNLKYIEIWNIKDIYELLQ